MTANNCSAAAEQKSSAAENYVVFCRELGPVPHRTVRGSAEICVMFCGELFGVMEGVVSRCRVVCLPLTPVYWDIAWPLLDRAQSVARRPTSVWIHSPKCRLLVWQLMEGWGLSHSHVIKVLARLLLSNLIQWEMSRAEGGRSGMVFGCRAQPASHPSPGHR